MIELNRHADGVLLPIHARPGARRNSVGGVHDGRLKVSVTQVAEQGKANREILRVLATALGLKASQLHLFSGQTSPQKVVLVCGEDSDSLHQRLAALS